MPRLPTNLSSTELLSPRSLPYRKRRDNQQINALINLGWQFWEGCNSSWIFLEFFWWYCFYFCLFFFFKFFVLILTINWERLSFLRLCFILPSFCCCLLLIVSCLMTGHGQLHRWSFLIQLWILGFLFVCFSAFPMFLLKFKSLSRYRTIINLISKH